MSNSEIVLAILLTFLLAILASQYTKADVLPEWNPDDIIAELGYVGVLGMDSNTEMEVQHRLILGYKGVYVFGTTEDMNHRMIGQGVSHGDVATAGLGFQYEFNDKFAVFIEAGKFFLDLDTSPSTLDEISLTYLVKRHEFDERPAPFDKCGTIYPLCTRGASIEYDDDWVGRVGLKFRPLPYVSISAGYRFMETHVYLKSWDKNTGRSWEENISEDLGAFEVGVSASW